MRVSVLTQIVSMQKVATNSYLSPCYWVWVTWSLSSGLSEIYFRGANKAVLVLWSDSSTHLFV